MLANNCWNCSGVHWKALGSRGRAEGGKPPGKEKGVGVLSFSVYWP
jgi:hypothetical protein